MKTRRFTLGELALVICTIIVLVLFFAIVFLVSPPPREKSARVNCAGDLKQIGLASLMYSGWNNGYFPNASGPGTNFEPLNTDGILTDGKVYTCPNAASGKTMCRDSNYRYVGSGLKDDDKNAKTIRLAYDSSGNHPKNKWMNVLFLDGHVEGARPDGRQTWNRYP